MLKCNSKNPKFKNLTIGKDYEGVIEGDFAEVVNDSGVKSRYHKKYFSSVELPPPPPRIRQLSLEQILSEIDISVGDFQNNGSDVYNTVEIDLPSRELGSDVYIYVARNSCGVIEIEGMNNVSQFAREILEDISSTQLETTTVSLGVLFDAILMMILREIRSNPTMYYPFYMLTTNSPDRDCFAEFNTRFTSTSSSSKTTNRVNPNSNSEIAVWIIDAEAFLA